MKRAPRCRICSKPFWEVESIELAHVLGREHDLKSISECDWENERTGDIHFARVALVLPDRVVPLCGPSVNTGSCHGFYDTHQLDLWGALTRSEQLQAVEDAGGLGQALRRTAPLTWLTMDMAQVEAELMETF